MDAKSGIFSAPLPGAYMFTVHACAHDQHKALLTLRKNGIQVASFYDQVRSKDDPWREGFCTTSRFAGRTLFHWEWELKREVYSTELLEQRV